MSSKSQEVYEYIVQYHQSHGVAPSVREIACGVGLRSPASVQHYIEVLAEAGMVTHAKGKMRTLVPSKHLSVGGAQ